MGSDYGLGLGFMKYFLCLNCGKFDRKIQRWYRACKCSKPNYL